MTKVNNNYCLGEAFMVAQRFLSGPGELGHQTKQEFICHALDEAVRVNQLCQFDTDAARRIILGRLNHINVQTWLHREGHLARNLPMVKTFDLCQEYRMRWLKELEREFFSKSD